MASFAKHKHCRTVPAASENSCWQGPQSRGKQRRRGNLIQQALSLEKVGVWPSLVQKDRGMIAWI